MTETTGNEDLAAAVRDRGMEQLEGAKGQLAEGAERVAAAVDRTADQIGGDEDNAISGFGHSVASLMRQLAGGLRERDIEEFAHELAALARRNPGVFLAGSVALGFGIARFFKARAPQSPETQSNGGWQSGGWGTRQSARGARQFDDEESLDLSASSAERRKASHQTSGSQRDSSSQGSKASQDGTSSKGGSASHDDEQDTSAGKSRQATKSKAKSQRASTGGSQTQSASTEAPTTDSATTSGTTESKDSAFTGGTGGGAPRGGKS